MKKNLLPLVFVPVAMLMLLLPSCTSEEEKMQLTKQEREAQRREDSLALKIAVLPTEDSEPILLADSLGLFEKMGVVVHLRKYGALSECRYALKKKMVEGAVIDSVLGGVVAKDDATDLTYGRNTSLTLKLVTAKKSRILRQEQLADKIIAADSRGASKLLAQRLKEELGKKRVFIVQCEDVKVRYQMLTAGNVDGALLPEPYASMAVKKGANVLKEYPDYKPGVIAFRSKAIADKRIRQQYDRFIAAYDMACDSIRVSKSRKASNRKSR